MDRRKEPNFVFILTDQQQREGLGCYGNQVADTPNIDRLAAGGVTFENAFCANGECMPSRASLLTGRMPRTHDLVANGTWLSPKELTLPQVLASNGYRTRHVGKIHLSPHGALDPRIGTNETGYESPEGPEFWAAGKEFPLPYYGFQEAQVCAGHGEDHMHYYRDLLERDPGLPELLKMENALEPPSGAPYSWKSAIPEEHHCSTWVGDKAVEALQSFAQANDPFFLFVGIPDPHVPFCPPAPWCYKFNPADMPMPKRDRRETESASRMYMQTLARYAEILPYHPMEMPEEHIREIIAHTYGMVSLLDKTVGRIIAALERLGLEDDTVVIFSTDHGEHLGNHWLIYKTLPYDELIHLPLIWYNPSRFAPGTRPEGIVSHIDMMPTILDLAGIQHPRGIQGTSYAEGLSTGEVAGRPYAYMEDDGLGTNSVSYTRTIRTAEYRLTYYLPLEEGELFDLRNDPNEFVNRWNDPEYGRVRREMTELLLQATMQASDPKPERVAPA